MELLLFLKLAKIKEMETENSQLGLQTILLYNLKKKNNMTAQLHTYQNSSIAIFHLLFILEEGKGM